VDGQLADSLESLTCHYPAGITRLSGCSATDTSIVVPFNTVQPHATQLGPPPVACSWSLTDRTPFGSCASASTRRRRFLFCFPSIPVGHSSTIAPPCLFVGTIRADTAMCLPLSTPSPHQIKMRPNIHHPDDRASTMATMPAYLTATRLIRQALADQTRNSLFPVLPRMALGPKTASVTSPNR